MMELISSTIGEGESALFARTFFEPPILKTAPRRVIHGNKLGRELGIPTANIQLTANTKLPYGIYAVFAQLEGRSIPGVASWGTRPNFDNGAPLLEVHLFDFKENIYDQMMAVTFIAFLRNEARFGSIEDFLSQVSKDISRAREILANGIT